jgi:hypothetical protein
MRKKRKLTNFEICCNALSQHLSGKADEELTKYATRKAKISTCSLGDKAALRIEEIIRDYIMASDYPSDIVLSELLEALFLYQVVRLEEDTRIGKPEKPNA